MISSSDKLFVRQCEKLRMLTEGNLAKYSGLRYLCDKKGCNHRGGHRDTKCALGRGLLDVVTNFCWAVLRQFKRLSNYLR
jgi:hypothetical protein